MSAAPVRPSPEEVAAIRAMVDRSLSVEEFNAYVNAPMSDDERRGIWELVDWFRRRYPSPLARLQATRRSTRNASRLAP